MTRFAPPSLPRWRLGARAHWLAALLCVAFTLMGARAAQLSMEQPAQTGGIAAARPVRGDLTDRHGVLLAVTVPTFTLEANISQLWDAEETAQGLAATLSLDRSAVLLRLAGAKGTVVLARRLTPAQRDAVFALGLPGLEFREEPRRFYPQARLGAHVIGSADAALVGKAGLERAFDSRLRQTAAPLRTSLDLRLQHALEAELEPAVEATGARRGAGVLLDGRTGEILALATAPSFDANRPPAPEDPIRLDQALGAVFEMGSTFKPLTVAMALDAGLTRPEEVFNLESLTVAGRSIRDYERIEGPAALETILTRSSNIGAAMLALRLGAERQEAYFKALGLTAAAPIPLPEAGAPLVPQTADDYTVAARGFGHGVSVSLLALARAYTVFVNDGQLAPLRFEPYVSGDPLELSPVFSPSAARTVLGYLRANVERGTGRRANLADLAVAGKTGTAEKYGPGGYDSDRNFSSFAAVFPAEAPRYVLLVGLDEPQPGAVRATGGAVAAPLAARIAARFAPLLGLAPTDATVLAAVEDQQP